MATLTKAINKNLFDSILPSFGNPRVHIPVWDDSQKMFICDEYESGNGHRYYRGILAGPGAAGRKPEFRIVYSVSRD